MITIDSLQDLNVFLRVWLISGGTTVFLPLLVFGISRIATTAQDDDQNAQYEQNYYYQNNNCRWYQWACKNNNYYQQNDRGEDDRNQRVPWWWFGGDEERRREGGASSSLVFCYIWSLMLFGAILYNGHYSLIDGENSVIIVALMMLANLSFVLMVLMQGVEGIVEADGPAVEENGFCGQLGVLMFLSSFLWLIFSVVFAYLIRRRASRAKVRTIEVDPSDYEIHSDDEMSNHMETEIKKSKSAMI